MLNVLVTFIIALLAGLAWNWTTNNQPMNYWLMASLFAGSALLATWLEWAWDWWRSRRRSRSGRARHAHARKATP